VVKSLRGLIIMHGKYIIIESEGLSVAIIFPSIVQHHMAIDRNKVTPLSAGFFEVNGDNLRTFGGSNSLGVDSRNADAAIVRESLFLMGIGKFSAQPAGVS